MTESKNKVALEMFHSQEQPIDMKLVSSMPDLVHLGITLKCSKSNWFIIVDDLFSDDKDFERLCFTCYSKET